MPTKREKSGVARGKEAILDAAEELFSRYGYHGVSLRDITKQANFELGLASYHFGTKDELFRQVVDRRVEEFKETRIRRLDDLIEAKGGDSVTVEDIVGAFIRVRLEFMFDKGPGWARYSRLSHHFLALEEQRGALMGSEQDAGRFVFARYVSALHAILPQHSREQIERRFNFLRLTLSGIVGSPELIAPPPRTRRGRDLLVNDLVAFFAAGFRVP